MKKIILFFCLAIGISCYAQDKSALSTISNIKFYGVDFSLAQFYGVSETPTELLNAFNGINQLFISEPKKYDVEKFTGKRVAEVSLEAVSQINSKIDPNKLMTTDKHYTVTPEAIAGAVKALPIKQEPGTGMVMLALLMDKAEKNGSYQLVFFNTETKEIIASWLADGKAQGFGLRNYWAYSAYKALKSCK